MVALRYTPAGLSEKTVRRVMFYPIDSCDGMHNNECVRNFTITYWENGQKGSGAFVLLEAVRGQME